MNRPECTPRDSLESAPRSEQVDEIRSLFGSPRLPRDPWRHGSSADQVISNPRIAIIDDEPINLKAVREHLQMAGYQQFFTTSDSTKAIDLIRAERPDVVLLDIVMPQVSGLDILNQLRETEEFFDLPVIILTAVTDHETKLEGLESGATEFLTKPVDSVELEVRLKNVLRMKAHCDRLKSHAWDLELEVAVRSAELSQAHGEVVQCLAKVGEYRDNATGRHVMRVGRYAEILARQMDFDKEFVARIRQAAPLHDIGKVGVSDAILLKPGKLDAVEYAQMQKHCGYGLEVCGNPDVESDLPFESHTKVGATIGKQGASPLLRMAGVIAMTHHEKWDGSGYPCGLVGEEIPMEGRITAIADVFDAMCSKRPYKPALPLEECLAAVKEGRGVAFDPAVVDAFLDRIDEIVQVYREYQE